MGTVPTSNHGALSLQRKIRSLSSVSPHTTHECQPLDVGLFRPLKRHWQQACYSFYERMPPKSYRSTTSVKCSEIPGLILSCRLMCVQGSKKAGVYLFNPKAIPVYKKKHLKTMIMIPITEMEIIVNCILTSDTLSSKHSENIHT